MTTRTAPVQASCTCRACDILGQRVARGAPGSANVPSPRQCGPQVQVPWHHGGHGAVDVVGPVALPGRTSGRGDKECTQIGENGLSAPFWGICVHCCDASRVGWNEGLDRHGAPAASPRWPLPFGRENKLCASAAAASLASLLRRSLTQTPEEPNDAWLALTIIAVVIGCTVSSFHSPYGSGQRLVLLGYTG